MPKQLCHDIITLCNEAAPEGLTAEDLAEQLHLAGEELTELFMTIDVLEKRGELMRMAEDRYIGKQTAEEITGIYKGYTPTFGFVLSEDLKEDVYISEQHRNTAMNNDKVAVRLLQRRGNKKEGQIVRIIERANTMLVGTFDLERHCGFVTPDNERIRENIYIPVEKFGGARSSARVLVKITKWPKANRKAEGEIVKVLGYDGDKDLDIKVIMARHDLPFDFPEDVKAAAGNINMDVVMEEGRADYRGRQLITIDSEDAKDLDDAIDVEKLPNGNFLLGVYIADVSYYVRPKSVIDNEAYERGTSVYLIDRVIPMLPTALSNDICSLNANKNRYAMACVMEIDHSGKVVHADIGPAVIRVKRRCNYKEVKKALLDDIAPSDLAPFLPMLRDLRELSGVLKQMRLRRGAVDFDFPEYKVILDEEGVPLRLEKRERTVAEQIVEECMLIANETVASYLRDSGNPSVYRIHEKPDPERMAMMRTVLSSFGLAMPDETDPKPAEFQQLLKSTKGTNEETVVQTIALRSMSQAKYATINAGHFGLASECYTHFTSPIRRYPDLMVHRLIRQYQKNGKLAEKEGGLSLSYHTIAAEHSSSQERIAAEAERETDDLKKAQYMKPFVGQAFDGHITGITSFGLFIGLENGIEGLLHVSYLDDDIYVFDETTYTMAGTFNERVFRLGDPMRVTLAKVNVERGDIDFVPGEIDSLEDLQHLVERSEEKRNKKQRVNTDSKQGKAPWFGAAAKANKKRQKGAKKKKKEDRRKGKKKKSKKGKKH